MRQLPVPTRLVRKDSSPLRDDRRVETLVPQGGNRKLRSRVHVAVRPRPMPQGAKATESRVWHVVGDSTISRTSPAQNHTFDREFQEDMTTLQMFKESNQFIFELEAKPKKIIFNPGNAVLARMKR